MGIDEKHTVMVDLDSMSFKRVKDLAESACSHFKLGGFIILKSSPNHYHVVFDKPMRYWSDVLRVISWIDILADSPNVWKWVCMQAIKKTCTLRVSEKTTENGVKPKPRMVYRYGSRHRQIKAYLKRRREILGILRKLNAQIHMCSIYLRACFLCACNNFFVERVS